MRKLIPLFAVIASAWVLGAWAAHAATYNFYFNNTEQGDGSTATPSVTVSGDGKVTKTPGAPAPGGPAGWSGPAIEKVDPALDGGQAGAPAAAAASGGVSAAQAPAAPARPRESYWRITLGVTATMAYDDSNGMFNGGGGLEPAGSVGYFFNRDLGLAAFGGLVPAPWSSGFDQPNYVLGLELEFLPVHITLGRLDDVIDLGLVGGGEVQSTGPSPEAGLRLNVNFGRSWALTSVARVSENFSTLEAGLAFRL